MKTIVINLLGAAGSGKSTLAGKIFTRLKEKGILCENIPEYAKKLVYEENYKKLDDQLLVFANQHHSMDIVNNARVLIVDSPLVLSLFYNNSFSKNKIPDKIFKDLVMHNYSKYDNLNYFIIRKHAYQQQGRYQDEERARKEEGEMIKLMNSLEIDVKYLNSTDNCVEIILNDLENRLEFLNGMSKKGEEIERKFLLREVPHNLKAFNHVNIVQAYVSVGERELRVRSINGNKFYLTEKVGKGQSRQENEKEISKEEFLKYYDKSEGRVINKVRYFYPINETIAEVDFYKDKHKRLATVEVELNSEEDAENFVPPIWFGAEVTDDKRYKNANLSQNEL